MRALLNILMLAAIAIPVIGKSEELKVGDPAPVFTLPNQDGVNFSLAERKGKGWTVLYFYPKAGTPGCTKEACAFRDAIEKIKALSSEVYGISSDTISAQKAFHAEHKLKFNLLADPDSRVIEMFGAKMAIVGFAKRWTFIIDPNLSIRSIERDVDPMLDADRVSTELQRLQSTNAQ